MITDSNGLTPGQSAVFMEVIDASLRIMQREHLFSWLQGSFQSLFAHEIMVCGIRVSDSEPFRFDSFVSTRYFSEKHAEDATRVKEGVIWRAMDAWQRTGRPILVAEHLAPGDFGGYTVPFAADNGVLVDAELRNIAAHGMGGHDGGVSTFFSFSRLGKKVSPAHAYMLQLLVPHLHATLTRVAMGNKRNISGPSAVSLVTTRESEILHWLHLGKTNWEIASILDISPLTVKNHVQNILRKLDVKNRSHAAVKAAKLGLVKS